MRQRIAGLLLLLLGLAVVGFASYGIYLTGDLVSLLALAHASDHAFDSSAWVNAWRISSAAQFLVGLGLMCAGILSWRAQPRAFAIIAALALFEAVFPWLLPISASYPFAGPSMYESATLVALAVVAMALYARK